VYVGDLPHPIFAANEGPGSWSIRDDSGTVDHLIDPAVVAQPDQHDMQTTCAQDQRELVIGLPDVGSVDTQWRGIHIATIGQRGLHDRPEYAGPPAVPDEEAIAVRSGRCSPPRSPRRIERRGGAVILGRLRAHRREAGAVVVAAAGLPRLTPVTARQDCAAGGVDDLDVASISGHDVDDHVAGQAVDLELGVEFVTHNDELLSGLKPEVLAERL
jgi:hypothetical protein